jgi:hypothetical protein
MGSTSALLQEGVTPTAFLLKEMGDVVAHASGGITDDSYDHGWGPERVLYAAVRHQRGYVFGVVVRYRVRWHHESRDWIPYREICWKIEEEWCGRTAYGMPPQVFSRLSPLEDIGEGPDSYAGKWRAETARRIAGIGRSK